MTDKSSAKPFQALGLQPTFVLDTDAVERAYRFMLAQAHPDAGGLSDGEMENEIDAAALNHARLVLINAESRANALLDVLGGPSASESKDLPEGFLMEMMTRREAIEEQIESAGEQSRSSWETWAINERKSYKQAAATLFLALHEPATDTALLDIRTHLNAWRYIERLIEQLDPDYDPQAADFR